MTCTGGFGTGAACQQESVPQTEPEKLELMNETVQVNGLQLTFKNVYLTLNDLHSDFYLQNNVAPAWAELRDKTQERSRKLVYPTCSRNGTLVRSRSGLTLFRLLTWTLQSCVSCRLSLCVAAQTQRPDPALSSFGWPFHEIESHSH